MLIPQKAEKRTWGKDGREKRRRAVMWSGLSVVGGILFLTALAVVTAPPTAARITDPTIRAGAKIFVANDCASCHKIHGQGGVSGPDLSFVGQTRDTEWLKTYVRDPEKLNPENTICPHRTSHSYCRGRIGWNTMRFRAAATGF